MLPSGCRYTVHLNLGAGAADLLNGTLVSHEILFQMMKFRMNHLN